VRAGQIGRFIKGGMNFTRIDEAFDFDNLGAFELNLCEVFRRNDYVLLWFKLVALDDFFARQRLATLLALLFVADSAVVLLMQLVEPDGFFRVHGIVNAHWNRHQREPDVSLPYRSHDLPRVEFSSFELPTTVRFTFKIIGRVCSCNSLHGACLGIDSLTSPPLNPASISKTLAPAASCRA